jgi:hypothetical protein
MSIQVVNGSCLCGRVRHRISGPLTDVRHCHCAMCRKAHGAAFRTRATVQSRDHAWLEGESLVRFYQSSPGTYRGFCSNCGSPLLTRFDADPAQCGLPLGGLDDDPGVRPQLHVNVTWKAPWYEIHDDLPQVPEMLPKHVALSNCGRG